MILKKRPTTPASTSGKILFGETFFCFVANQRESASGERAILESMKEGKSFQSPIPAFAGILSISIEIEMKGRGKLGLSSE